jgi:hypothetical protein
MSSHIQLLYILFPRLLHLHSSNFDDHQYLGFFSTHFFILLVLFLVYFLSLSVLYCRRYILSYNLLLFELFTSSRTSTTMAFKEILSKIRSIVLCGGKDENRPSLEIVSWPSQCDKHQLMFYFRALQQMFDISILRNRCLIFHKKRKSNSTSFTRQTPNHSTLRYLNID